MKIKTELSMFIKPIFHKIKKIGKSRNPNCPPNKLNLRKKNPNCRIDYNPVNNINPETIISNIS
ncbi:TPA: hypothetical protein DCZ31_02880 [Patescibacteria group bacterium]|nr:hypothetical protein [Candidatus Gracilibacteria bacterium]